MASLADAKRQKLAASVRRYIVQDPDSDASRAAIASVRAGGAIIRSVVAGKSAAPVYSPAVVCGDVVFVSGQVALDPASGTKDLVGADVGAQAAQCLANLQAVLAQAGSSTAQTTMVTIYMTDMSQYGAFNEAYKTHFLPGCRGAPPARACFAVEALPLGALVEVECTAVLNGAPRAVAVPGSALFSKAIVAGADQTTWVAGQVPIDPASGTKELVGGDDVALQARQSLANVAAVLEAAGSAPGRVSKVTVYLASIDDYAAVNVEYAKIFATEGGAAPPARAAFAVKGLPLGCKVEIAAIAAPAPGDGGVAGGVLVAGAAPRVVVKGAAAVPVYSPAIGIGGLAFVSGQIALDPDSGTKQLVGGDDVKAQTAQALKNLLAVLAMAGATAAGVTKCNIFVTDMAHYAAVNEVYKGVFTKDPPARACVAVKALPLGALVEIEAKAVRNVG